MLQLPTPLSEVRWINYMLPELLWLGLLIERYNYLKGSELGLLFALTAMEISKTNDWFGPISAYTKLNEEQKNKIVNSLKSQNVLERYTDALIPFAVFYPSCPLNFIFENNLINNIDRQKILNEFKSFLAKIFARRDKCAMFIQGSALYIALGSDLLKICVPESELPKIPNILTDYPNSEESKRAGSEVRASMNVLLGNAQDNHSPDWADYF